VIAHAAACARMRRPSDELRLQEAAGSAPASPLKKGQEGHEEAKDKERGGGEEDGAALSPAPKSGGKSKKGSKGIEAAAASPGPSLEGKGDKGAKGKAAAAPAAASEPAVEHRGRRERKQTEFYNPEKVLACPQSAAADTALCRCACGRSSGSCCKGSGAVAGTGAAGLSCGGR
jgi:hypothetical protein